MPSIHLTGIHAQFAEICKSDSEGVNQSIKLFGFTNDFGLTGLVNGACCYVPLVATHSASKSTLSLKAKFEFVSAII